MPPLTEGENQIYQTLYPSYSPMVKIIPLDVINDTDAELGVGDYMQLQRLENSAWVDVPMLPLPEGDEPLAIRPTISIRFMMPQSRIRDFAPVEKRPFSDTCDYYSLPLETGTYRLIDEFDNVSNAFEVLSAPSETQRTFIWQLNAVPAFKGATFSPHDFTVPFVCQGVISDSETSGVKIYVFFFPDDEEAHAVYDSIKQDGYVIPNRYWRVNDTFSFGDDRSYNWEDTPHFYLKDCYIYLYCGDDERL